MLRILSSMYVRLSAGVALWSAFLDRPVFLSRRVWHCCLQDSGVGHSGEIAHEMLCAGCPEEFLAGSLLVAMVQPCGMDWNVTMYRLKRNYVFQPRIANLQSVGLASGSFNPLKSSFGHNVISSDLTCILWLWSMSAAWWQANTTQGGHGKWIRPLQILL